MTRKLTWKSKEIQTQVRRLQSHGWRVHYDSKMKWVEINTPRGMVTKHHSLTCDEFLGRATYLANQLDWAKEDEGKEKPLYTIENIIADAAK